MVQEWIEEISAKAQGDSARIDANIRIGEVVELADDLQTCTVDFGDYRESGVFLMSPQASGIGSIVHLPSVKFSTLSGTTVAVLSAGSRQGATSVILTALPFSIDKGTIDSDIKSFADQYGGIFKFSTGGFLDKGLFSYDLRRTFRGILQFMTMKFHEDQIQGQKYKRVVWENDRWDYKQRGIMQWQNDPPRKMHGTTHYEDHEYIIDMITDDGVPEWSQLFIGEGAAARQGANLEPAEKTPDIVERLLKLFPYQDGQYSTYDDNLALPSGTVYPYEYNIRCMSMKNIFQDINIIAYFNGTRYDYKIDYYDPYVIADNYLTRATNENTNTPNTGQGVGPYRLDRITAYNHYPAPMDGKIWPASPWEYAIDRSGDPNICRIKQSKFTAADDYFVTVDGYRVKDEEFKSGTFQGEAVYVFPPETSEADGRRWIARFLDDEGFLVDWVEWSE